MRKPANQMCRVHWRMGQALLPEHFLALERSLSEESTQRARQASAPAWGVASLRWDGFELMRGIVSIQQLTLITAQGSLIDVPGNCGPSLVNMTAAGSRVSVYVHLREDVEVVEVGAGTELAGESVECEQRTIALSTNQGEPGAKESFKLAEFDCGPDGTWALRPDFIPPATRVEFGSPLFDPLLERIEGVLRALRQSLLDEVQEDFLSAGGNAAGRDALRAVFGLQALLADLHEGGAAHPYELFRELRGLYLDLCIHRDLLPKESDWAYRHHDIAPCFAALLGHLEDEATGKRETIPYREFARVDGLLVCDLGREVRGARSVFLLAQKPAVVAKLDLSRTKLASSSRIHLVHERSLPGVRFQKIDRPPFQHGLSATVEFYGLVPGEEWDFAIREGKLVFFDGPQLAGARFFLYWRGE